MDLRHLTPAGVTTHPAAETAALLARPDGVVWLDVPQWDDEAERVLREVFGVTAAAVRACVERNRVATFQAYPEHVFVALHAPEAGAPGHVHSIELDQFVAERYVVTVHGPLNAAADPASTRVEVDAVAARLAAGRLVPRTGFELLHALTSAVADRQREFVAGLTGELWNLEYRFQDVVSEGPSGKLGDPEQFLDELFRARHGFVVARTQAATSREMFARLRRVKGFGRGPGQKLLADLVDQFVHICAMADVEKENLQGTIEFYQARTNTELTVAAERLAVIAAVTLPITAVSSILGMNLIVNDATQPLELAVALVAMAVMSALLLRWARQHGWW